MGECEALAIDRGDLAKAKPKPWLNGCLRGGLMISGGDLIGDRMLFNALIANLDLLGSGGIARNRVVDIVRARHS